MSVVLPDGWVRTSVERSQQLINELNRELAPDHILAGVLLEAVADRDGASDDVLFRRLDKPGRFTVVHLTWRGRIEIDRRWPHIVFEGTFDEFIEFDSQHLDRSAE
jgi:hypothetical protein